MDTDVKTEGDDRRLNNLVAITVVFLTVFMAVSKTKDDNINQAMQKAKAESVDAWTEYQAARIKLHVDENGLSMLRLLETGGQIDKTLAARQAAEYEADIKKYQERSKETRAKAERLEAEYEKLNYRDDQFDTCRTPSCRSRSRCPPSPRWSTCIGCCTSPGPPAPTASSWALPALPAFPCGRLGWRRCWGPDRGGYCSNRSMNHLSSRVQISSLPTWSSMPCSRLGLSLTSITMKPWSVCLMSTP
jgi:Domain of unknown function (DUF4337)